MIDKVIYGMSMHGKTDAWDTTLSIKKMRFEPEKSRKRIFLFGKVIFRRGQCPLLHFLTINLKNKYLRWKPNTFLLQGEW